MNILYYVQGVRGFGHFKRVFAICEGLANHIQDINVIILTGSEVYHNFLLPKNTEVIKLPTIVKLEKNHYQAKYLSSNIDIFNVRKSIILSVIKSFYPNYFFVDGEPCGAKQELLEVFDFIKNHTKTRIILTLRDIFDESEKVIKMWNKDNVYSILENYYSKIFIFGVKDVFDTTKEYQFSDSIIEKCIFCGYFPKNKNNINETKKNQILVTVGGGSDGYLIIETYLMALKYLKIPIESYIVTGTEMLPMSTNKLNSLIPEKHMVTIQKVEDSLNELMCSSKLLITMAGFNTINEIIALKRNAIVIPRDYPTKEQLIRAICLEKYNIFDVILLRNLTPETLANLISKKLSSCNNSLNHCLINNNIFDLIVKNL